MIVLYRCIFQVSIHFNEKQSFCDQICYFLMAPLLLSTIMPILSVFSCHYFTFYFGHNKWQLATPQVVVNEEVPPF